MSKRRIWIKLSWCQLWEPTERSSSPRENWKNRAKTPQRDPTTKGKCCIWMHMECTLGQTSHPTGLWRRKGEPRKLFKATCYKRSFPTSSGLLEMTGCWAAVTLHWHQGNFGCWTSQIMQNAAVCFDEGPQNRCCCNLRCEGSCFKCAKPMWLASVVESQCCWAPFWKCQLLMSQTTSHWFLASQPQQEENMLAPFKSCWRPCRSSPATTSDMRWRPATCGCLKFDLAMQWWQAPTILDFIFWAPMIAWWAFRVWVRMEGSRMKWLELMWLIGWFVLVDFVETILDPFTFQKLFGSFGFKSMRVYDGPNFRAWKCLSWSCGHSRPCRIYTIGGPHSRPSVLEGML